MPRLHFTPWRNGDELARVRDHFYPPPSYAGPDMRERASALVAVWKLRGHLPHAVEVTGLLVEAILHDNVTQQTQFSIRACYSMAICRFVTGLVDRQQNHRFRGTMYENATKVGLPAFFVELRHQTVHEDIPALQPLRAAAKRALDWLWAHYWERLDFAGQDASMIGNKQTTETFGQNITDHEQPANSDLEESVEDVDETARKLAAYGWHVPQDWKPRPIGVA